MFATHLGDVVLAAALADIPTAAAPPEPPPKIPKTPSALPAPIPQLAAVVTRDTARKLLFVKLVNLQAQPQELALHLTGDGHLAPTGEALILSGADLQAVNSVAQPEKIVPVSSTVPGVKPEFNYTLPAQSVTVLQLHLE